MKYINCIGAELNKQQRSAKWLAKELGRHPQTVYKWCNNSCQPSLATLLDVARALKTTPDKLLNL